MIRFENITLQVQQQTLLKSTGLLVHSGDKVVVRGPSGCGKSSLLKAAVGALPLKSGSVTVDGTVLSADTVAQIRRRIGFIGQEPVLGAEQVRDALLLPFTFKTHREKMPPVDLIHSTLERLRLKPDILDSESLRISGGEKQRIAIARALLLNKSIFIADEITSALDPESKQAVLHELFRPEITILSVSHDDDWISACSRTLNIENQRIMEADL